MDIACWEELKKWRFTTLTQIFIIQVSLCIIREAFLLDVKLPADGFEKIPDNLSKTEISENILGAQNLPNDVNSMEYEFNLPDNQKENILNKSKQIDRYKKKPRIKEDNSQTSNSPSSHMKTMKDINCNHQFLKSETENSWLSCRKFQDGKDITEVKGSYFGKIDPSAHLIQTLTKKTDIWEESDEERGSNFKEKTKNKDYSVQSSPNNFKEPCISVELKFSKNMNHYNWDFVRLEPLKYQGMPDDLAHYFGAFSEINIYHCYDCFGIEARSSKRFYQIQRSLRNSSFSKNKSGKLNRAVMVDICLGLYDKSFGHNYVKDLVEFQVKLIDKSQNIGSSDTWREKEKIIQSYQAFINSLNKSIVKISKISIIMIRALFTLVPEYQHEKKFSYKLKELLDMMAETWRNILQGENEMIGSQSWACRVWKSTQINKDFQGWRKKAKSFYNKNLYLGYAWKFITIILLKRNEKLTQALSTVKNKNLENGKITKKWEIHRFFSESINIRARR